MNILYHRLSHHVNLKVGFLTVGPLMKILVTVSTLLGYLLSFLYPTILWFMYALLHCHCYSFDLLFRGYFTVFWEKFVEIADYFWIFSKPYLAQALEVLILSGKRAGVLFFEQDKWNIFFEVMTPLSLVLVVLLKKEFMRRKYAPS
jgi:hypothetical protein